MKTLIIALAVLGLLSCSESSKEVNEPFPNLLTEDVKWITYEGTLPTENGGDVLAVLDLEPSTPGIDSRYVLKETLHGLGSQGVFSMGTRSGGRYSVLFGSPGENIIQITNRTLIGSITRGKLGKKDRVKDDLFLKSNGDYELMLVDENFKEVVPHYRLIRRSELFTVEGYFTVVDDTCDYYERNTQRKWAVAKLGHYGEAVANYHSLAKEKFEGIYLKALSYSVHDTDIAGKEIEALVFKQILHIDSTGGVVNH